MPVKIKKAGGYVDATVMVKKIGGYVSANGMLKVANAYQSVTTPPDPSYTKTRAQLAAVSGGTGYARFAVMGDSTVAGFGSTGATPNRSGAVVVGLKAALRATQSRPVLSTSYIGDQSFFVTNGIAAHTVDSRLSAPDGTGYTAQTTRCAGGSMLANSLNANRLGFLAEDPVDTFDIYYARNAGLGSTKVNRVGSVQGTFNGAGTPSATLKYTYSTVLGSTDPLYFAINSGNSFISGIDAYDSTTKSVRLFGIGWSGGRVADWIANVNGFDPFPSLLAMQLDLVVLRVGTNDARTNSGLAAFSTNLTTLVDALIAGGTNVAIATHFPFDPAVASQAQQDSYVQAARDVATSRSLRVFDTYARIGTYANAVANGWMYDTLHPNASGYQIDTALMATFILSL